ncbi:unnamed protein product [Merluccius merluccius]
MRRHLTSIEKLWFQNGLLLCELDLRWGRARAPWVQPETPLSLLSWQGPEEGLVLVSRSGALRRSSGETPGLLFTSVPTELAPGLWW